MHDIYCLSICNISDITNISPNKIHIFLRYFAAPEQINNLNIYNETSLYEEIDEDYLVPEASGSNETSVKEETEPYPDDVGHYLELE